MEEIIRHGKWVVIAFVVVIIGGGFLLNWGICTSGWTSPFSPNDGTGGPVGPGSYANCHLECCKPNPWKCCCDSRCACHRRPDHRSIR